MLREDLVSFPELSYLEFQHSMDREITGTLKSLEKLRGIISKLQFYMERTEKFHNMSSCVKVSTEQYPSLYKAFVKMAQVLDVRRLPDLFIETNSEINAIATGLDQYSIKLYTGLLDLLTEQEIITVVGHELGYVKCDYILYKTLTHFIIDLKGTIVPKDVPFMDILDIGVQLTLLEWNRKAAFSADRAALLATQDIEATTSALAKLSGYSKSLNDPINIEALIKQTDELKEFVNDDWIAKYLKVKSMMETTYPSIALRVKEISEWGKSDHYKRILNGQYQKNNPFLNPTTSLKKGILCRKCKTINPIGTPFCIKCNTNLWGAFLVCATCGVIVSKNDTVCLNGHDLS